MMHSNTHFDLFHLPPQFALDLVQLEQAYRQVQTQVHPDRFATSGDAEKRLAMQWATRANQAYEVLRSPVRRAAYLCELHGIALASETQTRMPPDFLQQQFAWREQLQEAQSAGDTAALRALQNELETEQKKLQRLFSETLDGQADYRAAAAWVRQAMFLEKFSADVEAARGALEP